MQHVSPLREPLVTVGKTLHDVTQDISRQVEAKPNLRWLAAFAVALTLLRVFFYAVYRTLWYGIRGVGPEQNCWLGVGYHQLRVVGKYRSCRHLDFSRPVVVPPEVADLYQSGRLGDDHFRRYLRGHVPDVAHGTSLVGVLGVFLRASKEAAYIPYAASLLALREQG